jgi:hypothetical protein
MAAPIKSEAVLLRESLRKKLEPGNLVKVLGMWTGYFIGEVVDVGVTGCGFKIVKHLASGRHGDKKGSVVSLPYCSTMTIEPVTDKQS